MTAKTAALASPRAFLVNNRRFLPLAVTAALFFTIYAIGAFYYPGMRDPQVLFNLFRSNPFLLISAVGQTFVILTGGIDLSVSGVVALTTVTSAALIREGWNPWLVMPLMLGMGMAIGATMGFFITYLKVQPFIATLAGLWFARGMSFFISDDAIAINHPVYRLLGQTKILIPGLADPVTKTGDYISILVVVSLVVLAVGMFIAHYMRFGRNVYAIGGNEHSARLMGLPADRTKMLVYTLNGFCSALAGIALSIYVASGHGLYAQGFELTVIAAVVIGGTMLTGGVGYVFGTLFGVLITALIQTLIQFNGQLSSWWTSIAVGVLMLVFIGVQSILAARNARRFSDLKFAGQRDKLEAGRTPGTSRARTAPRKTGWGDARRRPMLLLFGGAILVMVLILLGIGGNFAGSGFPATNPTAVSSACVAKPLRPQEAAARVQAGAVIAYERNGGPGCIDELYAIYPDGRVQGDNGTSQIDGQLTAAQIEKLLGDIRGRGWFTNELYDTYHKPCGQCFEYAITVVSNGETKTVKAVDGGTDAPADYWQVVSLINGAIPKFPATP